MPFHNIIHSHFQTQSIICVTVDVFKFHTFTPFYNKFVYIKYYTYNKGLDSNTDGQITKTELNNRVVGKRVNESVFT